jgi:hypothetical protein
MHLAYRLYIARNNLRRRFTTVYTIVYNKQDMSTLFISFLLPSSTIQFGMCIMISGMR